MFFLKKLGSQHIYQKMHSRSFFDVSLRWGSRKKILHASSQKLERSLGRSTQTARVARVETIKPLQSPESQTRSTNQSKGSSTLRQGSLRERVLRTGRVLQIREGVVWSDKSAVTTSTRQAWAFGLSKNFGSGFLNFGF